MIRKKQEFVNRAQWHARNDHVVQGTYGEVSKNGHLQFRGCAIGCLATPHTKKGLASWLKGIVTFENHDDPYGPTITLHDGQDQMIDRIQDEFGVPTSLMRCVESVFEALPNHGEAIEFIPRFAKALPEGVEMTDEMVGTFWHEATKGNGYADYDSASFGLGEDDSIGDAARKLRTKLLEWLESLQIERRTVPQKGDVGATALAVARV